jgi:hypothetical protein
MQLMITPALPPYLSWYQRVTLIRKEGMTCCIIQKDVSAHSECCVSAVVATLFRLMKTIHYRNGDTGRAR